MRHVGILLIVFLFAAFVPAAHAQKRGGFTLLMTLGYGLYHGGTVTDDRGSAPYAPTTIEVNTRNALAGLNVGIGGFLSDRVAMMFRVSGTSLTVTNPTQSGPHSHDLTSGVGALDVQWWTTDRINVEMGAGYGIIKNNSFYERGIGLIAGVGYSLFVRGSHSFQVGIEYAPAITHTDTVHNVGFCVGFQFL